METLTVKELEGLLKSEPFKFICLTDADGNTVVAWNNPKIKLEQRKKEIVSQLKSTSLPDGLYIFKIKQTNENNNVRTYNIVKGKGVVVHSSPSALRENKPEPKVIVQKEENVLGWSSALEMTQKIATLQAQNAALTKENDDLASELDEIEEGGDLSEADTNKGFGMLEKLFEKVIPLADKYFENKDRELSALEELSKAKAGGPGPVYAPKNPTAPVTPTPQQQPTVIPQPGAVTQVFTPPSSGGASGGGTENPVPDKSAEDADVMEVLASLSFDELSNFYTQLKSSANLTDLRQFVRVLKKIRPVELKKIVEQDIQ